MTTAPQTMLEKVWRLHEVSGQTADTPAVLYIDLHLIHEVTSPQAFTVLRERGLPVRRVDLTLATMDHSTPTRTEQIFGGAPITIDSAAKQVRELEVNCAQFGVELLGLRHAQRGIVHIIGPELGITQPGKTVVCGDSHTSTHGALGALAFGIGTTGPRSDGERPHPGDHRQDRRGWRNRARHRISRGDHSRTGHG